MPAKAASGDGAEGHAYAQHLIMGLAEPCVEYAEKASARKIYEAFLMRRIIIQRRLRGKKWQRPGRTRPGLAGPVVEGRQGQGQAGQGQG